jgi:hypothetical protein
MTIPFIRSLELFLLQRYAACRRFALIGQLKNLAVAKIMHLRENFADYEDTDPRRSHLGVFSLM